MNRNPNAHEQTRSQLVGVRLPRADVVRLRELAQQQDRTASAVARRLIQRGLNEQPNG